MWDSPFQTQTQNHCELDEAKKKLRYKTFSFLEYKSFRKRLAISLPLCGKHPLYVGGVICQDPKVAGEEIYPDPQILECKANQLSIVVSNLGQDVLRGEL